MKFLGLALVGLGLMLGFQNCGKKGESENPSVACNLMLAVISGPDVVNIETETTYGLGSKVPQVWKLKKISDREFTEIQSEADGTVKITFHEVGKYILMVGENDPETCAGEATKNIEVLSSGADDRI